MPRAAAQPTLRTQPATACVRRPARHPRHVPLSPPPHAYLPCIYPRSRSPSCCSVPCLRVSSSRRSTGPTPMRTPPSPPPSHPLSKRETPKTGQGRRLCSPARMCLCPRAGAGGPGRLTPGSVRSSCSRKLVKNQNVLSFYANTMNGHYQVATDQAPPRPRADTGTWQPRHMATDERTLILLAPSCFGSRASRVRANYIYCMPWGC